MKFFLALAVLLFVSQAHGYGAGRAVSVEQKDRNLCQDCLKVFGNIQGILKSKDLTDMLEELAYQRVCSKMKTLEPVCKDFVNQYVPKLIANLANRENATRICSAMRMCTADIMKFVKPVVQKQVVKGEECDLCKEAVGELKTIIQNPQTQTQVKDFIENQVCPMFGSLADMCKQEVENYAAIVFEYIENEMDPTTVCQDIRFCTQTKMMSLLRVGLSSSVTKVKTITSLKKMDSTHGFGAGRAVSVDQKDPNLCQDCLNLFGNIQGILKSKDLTDMLEQLAYQRVCSKMQSLESVCKDFVNQYVPKLIANLANRENASRVCKDLRMCTGDMMKLVKPVVRKQFVKGEECDLCKEAVGELKTIIQNPQTQTQVKDFIENQVCPMFGSLADMCKQEVENYAAIVFEFIENDLDPTTVCQDIRFCTQMKMMSLLRVGLSSSVTKVKTITSLKKMDSTLGYGAGRAVSVDQKDSNLCQDCLNLFGNIQGILKSKDLLDMLEQLAYQDVCSKMKTLEPVCKNVVNEYVPMLIANLANRENASRVCKDLQMCTGDMMKLVKPVVRKQVVKGEECDLCKEAVGDLKKFIQDQQTQTQVKDFIENQVCPLFGSLANECKQEVENYATMVFEFLENEMDPTIVCQDIGLCTQKKMMSLARVGLSSSVTKVKTITSQKKMKDSKECVLCEFVVNEVAQLLRNNNTQAAIEQALEKVCSVLPSTVTTECKAFVETYGNIVLQLLVQQLDPKEICTQIKLCTAAFRSVKPDTECYLCEFIMSEVDELILNNKSEDTLVRIMDRVCDLMPATVRVECKNFTDKYEAAIINLLVNKLKPEEVCKTLLLCNNGRVKAPKIHVIKTPKKVSASAGCVLCEFIINELDTILGDNRTQVAVEAALDKVCSLMPDTIRPQCVDFVNEYAPAIMALLIQELAPESICTALGVCSNPAAIKGVPLEPLVGDEKCNLCDDVLNYVVALLKENATEQEVEEVLDKVCNFLPTEMRTQCLNLVNQYTSLILNLISDDIVPRQLCEELGLCQASQKAKELKDKKLYFTSGLLGRDKCTFGPSYWCSSKENAVRCRAMEHCQKHVWKLQ